MLFLLRRVALPTVALACAACCLNGCVPARPEAAPRIAGANPERGRALLAQYQCGTCHAIDGVPASRGNFAAPLDHFGARSYIAGRLANDPATLAQWIAAPRALVPETTMPSMGVTPADARDMAAWLQGRR